MIRITSIFLGLAIIAACATSQAEVNWAAGAPGGTTGGSLDFDNGAGGTTSFLDTGVAAANLGGDRSGVNPPGDYTISMMINARTLGTESWFLGTGNQGLHLGQRGGTGVAANSLSQGHWGADSDGTTTLGVGAWNLVTFSFDADGGTTMTGEQKIYLNGILEATTDNAAPNNSTTNVILGGRNNGGNGPQWDGQIDDVAFWGSQLSDADVTSLAGGTSPLSLGVDAYWDFEDDQSTGIAAVQGSGNLGAASLTGITPSVVPEPSSLAILMGLSGLVLVRRKRS